MSMNNAEYLNVEPPPRKKTSKEIQDAWVKQHLAEARAILRGEVPKPHELDAAKERDPMLNDRVADLNEEF